ncbi:Uncharacterized protein QTN25_004703 [Entamoeba marina]
MLFTFLLLSLTSAITCEELVGLQSYTVDDAFDCINSVTVDEQWTSQTQEGLLSLFETYVFKDILINPPQPEGYPNFFTSVNIDERLKALPLDETSVYTFMQKAQSIINDAHDLHLSFRLTSNDKYKYYFDSIYAALPFTIDIINEGKDVIFLPNDAVTSYGITIPNEITNNKDVAISTINGDDPLKFIRNYAETYTFLKSPHGRFTYAIESMNFVKLSTYALPQSYLNQPITIVYSNGDSVTVSYSMVYLPPTSLTKKQQDVLKQKEKSSHATPITINDFISKPKKASSVFDHESADSNLACKTITNDQQNMNVIVLKTFYPEYEVDDFFDVFDSCIHQFDDNDYPITVILPMNGGGYADLESNFEKVLAPHSDTDLIGSSRISDGTEGCFKHEYGQYLFDPDTCNIRYNSSDLSKPLGPWYDEPKSTTYGTVEHSFSQPSLMHAEMMLKSKFEKHPRKPQEVIVMTDGFCYSACSVLAKGMVDKGGAIVVGFEGDPEGDVKQFDAGNSPTPVITQDELFIDDVELLAELGGYMRISFLETFEWNYNYDETIPREFVLNVVDERVHVYKYDESKLDEFVEKSTEIYLKYQNECNPDNKRFVKVDDKCDDKITIEHAHGGYACGTDGKWSSTCQASYCDDGYKFDYYNQKCVIDSCYESETSSSTPDDDENLGIIIFFCVSGVVIVALLVVIAVMIGYIVFLFKKSKGYDSLN